MVITEESIRDNRIMEVARAMMCAARTAPKARGIDNLVIATITNDDIIKLSEHTKKMYETNNQPFFLRDSENILKARAIVLIGTKISTIGLNCGLCGFPTCEEKLSNKKFPCMFNSNDLGIAIGSAVGIASDNRIDSRVMYSAGIAAKELSLYGEDVAYGFAIPLSVLGKNPFFDRPTV